MRNIEELRPTKIVLFQQLSGPFSINNAPYLENVFNGFDSTLRQLTRTKMPQLTVLKTSIDSMWDYPAFIAALLDVLDGEVKNFHNVWIDCTGLPKIATIGVIHVCGMFEDVMPIYNRPAAEEPFGENTFTTEKSDQGGGWDKLPFRHRFNELKWWTDRKTSEYSVLRAIHQLYQSRKVDERYVITKEDIVKHFVKTHPRIKDRLIRASRPRNAIYRLEASGWVQADPRNPKRFCKPSLIALGVARHYFRDQIPPLTVGSELTVQD
jgi:hypothetical protein